MEELQGTLLPQARSCMGSDKVTSGYHIIFFNVLNTLPQGHIIARKSEVIYVMPAHLPPTEVLWTHQDAVINDKEEAVPS